MRFLRLTGAILLASALPIAAFAQSVSSPSTSSLIAEITALEQQIQALTGIQASATSSSATTAPQQAAASSSECPTLSRTLSYGASGTDVISLQSYLAAQQDFAGAPTGYFGSITQAAVGQWQVANGVVAAGDTNAGLGIVGPRTLAAIASACGGSAPAGPSCLPTQPPTAECAAGWQPVADAAGCTEYYQCTIALPTTQISTSTSVQSTATTSCAVVAQPSCSGQVVPFQTHNGCVTSYECVL